jgi:pSer/pThr/pTyr-binding forkhead associated (FHA) protein
LAQLILTLHNRELRRVPIQSILTTIGRDLATDMVIDNVGVSRVHARIDFDGQRFVVTDCKSRNGITVNGARTPVAALREGDVIGINKFLVQFSLSGGVPPAALGRPERVVRGRPRDFQQTMQVDKQSAARISERARADIEQQREGHAQAQAAAKRRELMPSGDFAEGAPTARTGTLRPLLVRCLALGCAILAMVVVLGL